jgi:hypothetical protein
MWGSERAGLKNVVNYYFRQLLKLLYTRFREKLCGVGYGWPEKCCKLMRSQVCPYQAHISNSALLKKYVIKKIINSNLAVQNHKMFAIAFFNGQFF